MVVSWFIGAGRTRRPRPWARPSCDVALDTSDFVPAQRRRTGLPSTALRWCFGATLLVVSSSNIESTRADTAAPVPNPVTTPDNVRIALQVPPRRVAELRDRALTEALQRHLLQEAAGAPPSEAAVKEYYERFRDRFVSPDAIEVWRILVDSEDLAKSLITRVKESPTPQKTWSLAAREHSVDKATHFRKGHLGFVRADGTTDVPQVRVSPSVFAAASKLEDGSFSAAPFREGERWGILWRRGVRKERGASLEQARPEIAQQLAVAAARSTLHDLLAKLRSEHVADFHPELVESLPSPAEEGIRVQRFPREPRPADGSPTPRKTDWGER